MNNISSEELSARLHQLNQGLITEAEFVLSLQLPLHLHAALQEFSNIDLDQFPDQVGSYSLNYFSVWYKAKP